MRFGSVCSGIEAASMAWHPLGWETAYVADIEPFPNAVLAQRVGATAPKYRPDHIEPDDWARGLKGVAWGERVPNFGDFTRIATEADRPEIDLLVGGTPCQAFSVAGARQSLADRRGNLTLSFVDLVHATKSLRWVVWENVPGVLSTDDNAFGCFLAGLVGADDALPSPRGGRWPDSGMVAGPRGRAAWCIKDAQYFGLAQRRRRVFLVFCPRGSNGDPVAVLFERKGVRRHPSARGEAGQGIAPCLSARTNGGGGLGTDFDLDGGLIDEGSRGVTEDLADTLTVGANQTTGMASPSVVAAYGGGNRSGAVDVAACLVAGGNKQDFEVETFVAHTLRAEGFDASEDGTGRGTPLVPVAFALRGREDGAQPELEGDQVGALRAASGGSSRSYVAFQGRGSNLDLGQEVTGTLTGNSDRASGGAPCVAFDCKSSGQNGFGVGEVASTLRSMGHSSSHQNGGGHAATMQGSAVRRLTPRECERLQGFPDDHTLITWKGKEAPDGPRYKALGNSMAVPVMRWIGERIAAYEAGTLDAWRFVVAQRLPGGGWPRPALAIQGTLIGRGENSGPAGSGVGDDVMFTLTKSDVHAVAQ